jgi:hypothetical protein
MASVTSRAVKGFRAFSTVFALSNLLMKGRQLFAPSELTPSRFQWLRRSPIVRSVTVKRFAAHWFALARRSPPPVLPAVWRAWLQRGATISVCWFRHDKRLRPNATLRERGRRRGSPLPCSASMPHANARCNGLRQRCDTSLRTSKQKVGHNIDSVYRPPKGNHQRRYDGFTARLATCLPSAAPSGRSRCRRRFRVA